MRGCAEMVFPAGMCLCAGNQLTGGGGKLGRWIVVVPTTSALRRTQRGRHGISESEDNIGDLGLERRQFPPLLISTTG